MYYRFVAGEADKSRGLILAYQKPPSIVTFCYSATTASTSISTSHSGFTKLVTAMIVSTGRLSTQYFFLASMASFQVPISVRMTRVRTIS